MACSIDLTWSGIGEGGSGSDRVDGSGGILRILNENMMEPSENSDVSGKLENALIVSLASWSERTHSPFPLVPTAVR
jgi:hypothetical protein